MTHTYENNEQWQAFHPNEDFDTWLKWRLSVDRGETRSQMMTIIRPEFGYESPTTGNVITNDKARREDLSRSGCIEYDPEMKTDQKRRIAAQEAELDRKFDETISARLWRNQNNSWWWAFWLKAVNTLFFWQNNHCRGAYNA